MTAALEGSEWSASRPGRTLPPGKTRCPLYRRLGGLQGRSGRAENLVPTGIRSRTVQPVVSRYTNWATGPTEPAWYYFIIMNQTSVKLMKAVVFAFVCLVINITGLIYSRTMFWGRRNVWNKKKNCEVTLFVAERLSLQVMAAWDVLITLKMKILMIFWGRCRTALKCARKAAFLIK